MYLRLSRISIPAVSLAVTSALAGAWLIEPWMGTVSPAVRWLLVAAALVVSSVLVWYAHRKQLTHQQRITAIFRALCELRGASHGSVNPALPELGDDDPLRELFEQVRQTLEEHGEQVRKAEHARTSAEVRARRATQRSEYLENILNGLPEAVIAIDPYDEVVFANASAETLCGFQLRSAEDRGLERLVRCQPLVESIRECRRRRTRQPRNVEIAMADEAGEPQPHVVTLSHFTLEAAEACPSGGNGQPRQAANGSTPTVGVIAVLRDVSSLKAIQKRNAEFVSAVSHEMKTPLAGIKAYVELLADGEAEDDATREEFLTVINSQADRLQRLIDNLLNLTRIEAGVVSVNKRQQSFNSLLEEAYNVVLPAAQQKGIELVSDLSGLHLPVLVDRDMMLQAAINLLSNAVKYTRSGGTVTMRSRLDGNRAVLDVEDSGVGLSSEDAERVFEKFYRVKKDQDMAPGTGLGLPLAKHIVEEVHGGELSVESELGVGSTFTISLPMVGSLNLVETGAG